MCPIQVSDFDLIGFIYLWQVQKQTNKQKTKKCGLVGEGGRVRPFVQSLITRRPTQACAHFLPGAPQNGQQCC